MDSAQPKDKFRLLLPDFDPEKHAQGDIIGDACAWMATADLCMAEKKLEGAALMIALSKAFKNHEALTWLSQVAFPNMTWSDFKVLFLSRYVRQDTTASFLINLVNQKPKEGESLISYAGMLLKTFENRWKYINKKQLAVACVLAHISQFAGPEVKRLALTKEIRSKTELQKELTAVTNKRPNTSILNDNEGPAAKRIKTTVELSICYKCNKSGHNAAQCRAIYNATTTQPPLSAAQLSGGNMPRNGNSDMTVAQRAICNAITTQPPSTAAQLNGGNMPRNGNSDMTVAQRAICNTTTTQPLSTAAQLNGGNMPRNGNSDMTFARRAICNATTTQPPSTAAQLNSVNMPRNGNTDMTVAQRAICNATTTQTSLTAAELNGGNMPRNGHTDMTVAQRAICNATTTQTSSTAAQLNGGNMPRNGNTHMTVAQRAICNATTTQTSPTAAQLNGGNMPRNGNTHMTVAQPGTSKAYVDLTNFTCEISRLCGNLKPIHTNFSEGKHDIVDLCGTSRQHGNLIHLDAEVPITTTEINGASTVPKNTSEARNTEVPGELYKSLVDLEMLQLAVPNSEPFQCPVCTEDCQVGAGVVLRDCAHHFCRECLSFAVKHSTESSVGCLATGCTGSLEEREIRSLTTPEEYEQWLARGLAVVERSSKQAFHCRMRDCRGWAFCEATVQNFHCPVCQHVSCVPCKEIHEGVTCEQHKLRKKQDLTQQKSTVYLDKMLASGKAMKCPECGITITKVDGCDAITCSACKTQICWATRGRRWGPRGAGDITGGCRCKVNGKRCHPSCKNCH